MALGPTPAMNLRARPPRMDVASPPETRTLHIFSWWCLHLHMAKDPMIRGRHARPCPTCRRFVWAMDRGSHEQDEHPRFSMLLVCLKLSTCTKPLPLKVAMLAYEHVMYNPFEKCVCQHLDK